MSLPFYLYSNILLLNTIFYLQNHDFSLKYRSIDLIDEYTQILADVDLYILCLSIIIKASRMSLDHTAHD